MAGRRPPLTAPWPEWSLSDQTSHGDPGAETLWPVWLLSDQTSHAVGADVPFSIVEPQRADLCEQALSPR